MIDFGAHVVAGWLLTLPPVEQFAIIGGFWMLLLAVRWRVTRHRDDDGPLFWRGWRR